MEILESLLQEELQFSQLQRKYPDLSGKMLSRRVKELFELGLIGKAISSIQPLEFKYYISDKGKMLQSLFYQIAVTGTKMFREAILDDPSMDTTDIERYFKNLYS